MVHSEGNQTLASIRFLFSPSAHTHIKEHQRAIYKDCSLLPHPSQSHNPAPQGQPQSTLLALFSVFTSILVNKRSLYCYFIYLSFLDLSTPIHFSSSHPPYIVTSELRVMSIVSIYIILWLCKYGSRNLIGMLCKCFFSCSFFFLWNY